MKKNYLKDEKGFISTFVGIAGLFFVIVLTGLYISINTLKKSQINSNLRMKEIYEQDVNNVDEIYGQIASQYGGAGTQEDPWKIFAIEDLIDLAQDVNSSPSDDKSGKYYELIRDLDFRQDASYKNPTDTSYGDLNGDGTTDSVKTEMIKTSGTGFKPIGDSTNSRYFAGNFNGNGHSITNVVQNDANLSEITIFLNPTGTASNYTATGSLNGVTL